jgi:hypothetical protein
MPPEMPPEDRLVPIEEAAQRAGRAPRSLERWVATGLLTPFKKRGDRRTHIDLAELPEAMRRAGKPGPKPQPRGGAGGGEG